MISEACSDANSKRGSGDEIAKIHLEKGDYAVETLRIPKDAKTLLFSKDRARILYTGKRNRPMFVLEDNSEMVLQGKIEIYYNTNNVQEASKLMIKSSPNSKAEISKEVKVMLFSVKQ